jgi:phage-related protein
MAAKVEVDIFANDRTGGVLGNVASGLGNIMTTAAGFITGTVLMNAGQAIGDMFASTITEATEAQASLAQMEAALKSTGGAAGLSSQELQDYATQLQNITAFDDEAIQGAESLLLTFTNVKGDIFKDATATILDMSQAMGQDLKSSSIQLGKALQDPIAGVGTLSRVGVQFSDSQKEMIKTLVESGDIMGAQKIILAELDKQFGGSAEAFANTYAGKMQQFNNTMGNVKETIGSALLPIMTDFMTDVIVPMLPAVQAMADRFSDWMEGLQESAGLEKIINFTKLLSDAFVNLFGELKPGQFNALEGLQPIVDGIGTALETLANFDLSASPLGEFLAFLSEWGEQYGPGIMESFSSIFNTVWSIVSDIFTRVSAIFVSAMGQITAWLAKNGPLIQRYFALIAERLAFLGEAFKVVLAVAQPILEALIAMILNLVTFVMAMATGDWATAWQAFLDFFTNAALGIWNGIVALWEGILGLFGTNSAQLKTQWNAFWQGIVASVTTWANGIRAKATDFFNAGKYLIQGFINGVKSMFGNVVDTVTGVADAVIKDWRDRFDMESPSKLFEKFGGYVMEGFANGLHDGAAIPVKMMGQVVPQINNAAAFGMPAMAGAGNGGIVINIDARDSLLDERWFATKFKTGVVQVLRDTGVEFRG